MSCHDDLDPGRLARHSPHFQRCIVELAAGEELRTDTEMWRDAIVFLETGVVELECRAGERRRFATGSVLCLLPPVRMVRNCGGNRARLLAISRQLKFVG